MSTARTGLAGVAGLGKRGAFVLLAGCLLGGTARANVPTVEDVLKFRPKQAGVDYSTPAADKVAACKVDWQRGTPKGGWTLTLKDGDGNLLRCFVDTNGDNGPDVWSYYKDGAEVYREVDTTKTKGGVPDQYRWLNAGGSKWGVDLNKDGTIDSWKVISPEEVSQELLRALVAQDGARLQALLITDAEVKALGLPAKQADQLRELRKGAAAKLKATAAKLSKLSAKANWLHLETGAPHCAPAEQTGARADLIKHPRGTVLVEVEGGSEWFQTGEMIQVGAAWRLTDAPAPGPGGEPREGGPDGPANVTVDPAVQELVKALTEHDKKAAPGTSGPEVVKHHLARADLLEKIATAVKPAERETWYRQVADSLGTAAQAGTSADADAVKRLATLEKELAKAMPGGNLTAYVVFRGLQADYALKIAKGDDFAKVQQGWVDQLTKFVQDYPKAEDTPDAMLQLGLVSEFLGKDVEAKNWYAKLAKAHAGKPQAEKADGAVRRLELEGKALKLAGPRLGSPGTAFDVESLRGQVVVVYYWASWNAQCAGDFAKLQKLVQEHGKAVAVVGVNLDDTADKANDYLKKTPAPGVHLHQPGGLEGKLATGYGVMVLPNVFLVGKDGKVISRSAQVGALEDEVKKHLKK